MQQQLQGPVLSEQVSPAAPAPLPAPLEYEVVPCKLREGAWRVEAIHYGGDGEIYTAVFSGPLARERAEEYAAWKWGRAVRR